jgi:HEAT repeat protein
VTARRVVALSLVALACGAYLWLDSGTPRGLGEGTGGGNRPSAQPFKTSAECRACHREVYDEWASSHHALAYVNPEVQFLTKNFRDRDCLPCHAPEPVLETTAQNRVVERGVRLEDGVDCMACHKRGDDMMGGPTVSPDSTAPCRPRPFEGIADVSLCAPCHDQHKVVQDWRRTEYAVPGKTFKNCSDCHFPKAPREAANGRPAYEGRSHKCLGAHDATYLRTAATFRTALAEDGALEIEVKNDGTGHNFPADERHRSVDLVLVVETNDGRFGVALVDRYRNPYRDEFHLKNPLRTPGATRTYSLDLGVGAYADVRAARIAAAYNPNRGAFFPENTQIPAGEARRYRVFLPTGLRAATVRAFYKLKPPQTYEEATLLFEARVDLPGVGPNVFGAGGFDTPPPPLELAPPSNAPKPRAPHRVELLAKAYLDPEEPAERRAARILEIDDVALLRYLVKDRSQSAFVLFDDPDSETGVVVEENPFGDEMERSLDRVAALVALERIGGARALPEILLALDDRDRLVAVHAARVATRLGSWAGLPVLIDALEGKIYANEHARRFLAEFAGDDFGFNSDSGMTRRAEAIAKARAWLSEAKASGRPLPKTAPPYRRGDDPMADRRVAAYAELLGGFQFLYMEQARKMLRRLGPEAASFLKDALPRAQGDAGATWRGGMAQVLGAVSGPVADELFKTFLADPHPSVRARATTALAERDGAAARERILAALSDRDMGVVAAAARALATAGRADDADLLDAIAARSDASIEVAAAARATAMRLAPTPARFDALAALLFDASMVARVEAIDALNAVADRVVLEDPLSIEEDRRAALDVWREALK